MAGTPDVEGRREGAAHRAPRHPSPPAPAAPSRDYVVTLNGATHRVRVTETAGGYEVTVGDRPFRVDSRRLNASGLRSLIIDNRPHEAEVREEGRGSFTVHLGGESFGVEVQDHLAAILRRGAGARRTTREEKVVSPMPGLVIAVEVAAGEVVVPGHPVAIVEAMKMQNEIPTVHGGRVREIAVRPGQVVQTGQVLLVLEPEG